MPIEICESVTCHMVETTVTDFLMLWYWKEQISKLWYCDYNVHMAFGNNIRGINLLSFLLLDFWICKILGTSSQQLYHSKENIQWQSTRQWSEWEEGVFYIIMEQTIHMQNEDSLMALVVYSAYVLSNPDTPWMLKMSLLMQESTFRGYNYTL